MLRQDRNSCVRPELKLLFDAENVARTSNAALRARKSVTPGPSFDVSRIIDPVIDPCFPNTCCRLLGFNLMCLHFTKLGRDAMEVAKQAEEEILRADANISQVSMQLRLGQQIKQLQLASSKNVASDVHAGGTQ